MSKYKQMSAKDRAFERERVQFRSTIQKKDEEIAKLTRELNKCRSDAESWEETARLLEAYIGIPKEEIIKDIAMVFKLQYLKIDL